MRISERRSETIKIEGKHRLSVGGGKDELA
jgi:hypothetical protein